MTVCRPDRRGRAYEHGGDIHRPEEKYLLVAGERIAACRRGVCADIRAGLGLPELPDGGPLEQLDSKRKLVIPGLVNSRYHSQYVPLKGCFETIPLQRTGRHVPNRAPAGE